MFSPWLSFSSLDGGKGSVVSSVDLRSQPAEVKGQEQVLPEEVKVLEGLPRVRGLKLPGVEHEEPHEIQPPHAGGVARLVADCTMGDRTGHNHAAPLTQATTNYGS